MPRQARTDRILQEKEQKLEAEVRRVAGEVERLTSELRLVRDLRKQLVAPPRSRAKGRTVAVPAAASANTEQKASAA